MNTKSETVVDEVIRSLEGCLTDAPTIYEVARLTRNALQELDPREVGHDTGADPRQHLIRAQLAADELVNLLSTLHASNPSVTGITSHPRNRKEQA